MVQKQAKTAREDLAVGIRHASLLFPVEVVGGPVNAVLVVLAVNVLTHINSYLVCLLTIAL